MRNNAAEKSEGIEKVQPAGVWPSKFMRELRPEIYSDTKDREAYVLSAPVLEYHLDSITSRNQTHDFEVFCRKLCERTICPNLRPQTGPDGGGDSKADTETYSVADEISGLTYVGVANGSEKWAFAFSAKSAWADKVRKDVQGLIDTGRTYDQIICVTSRFAKSKNRAALEHELSEKYGVPVTIHDRTWIVKEVIENARIDLAVNYLKVGETIKAPTRLGPKDYSRTQQLEDVEREIQDPEAFRGMEQQRAMEALVAAKLSRGLERPRIETEGRFSRAIRLAEAHGSFRQKLEAEYEKIWTDFWWFDDFQSLNAAYDHFQDRAIQSDHVKNLEFLCNLNQLLVNALIHKHLTPAECRFGERIAKLEQALTVIADDPDRPNNSLEAQTALLRIKLNKLMLAHKPDELPSIWKGLTVILQKAEGLGEFDADGLASFIEVVGNVGGNDPAYGALVEKLAEFIGARKGEGEGALVLLKRAEKLDFSARFDMIRWAGKAAFGLSKREYADSLIDAMHLLTLGYRSAGLLWATRASCIFAAASLVIQGEEEHQLPRVFAVTMKVWAWTALELCHLPDCLQAIQLMNGCIASMPLDEEEKAKIKSEIQELDVALGCYFLNLQENDHRKLETAPDILEALGLFMARTGLLFSLGYTDLLREDGSLPKEEPDENVRQILAMLKSQALAERLRGPLIVNSEGPQIFATTILGMKVEVLIDGSESIAVAELVLGSLEAFFATIIEQRVVPHTELFRITIAQSDGIQEPVVEANALDMTCTITWPRGFPVAQLERQHDVRKFFMTVAGHVLSTACVVEDMAALLENLFCDAAAQQRMIMIATAQNSYRRLTSRGFTRLGDWSNLIRRSYAFRGQEMELPRIERPPRGGASAKPDTGMPEVKDHKEVAVSSVINVHAWDQAKWRGCGYLQLGNQHPPVMALLFENEAAARKIFERWRERFGSVDTNEELTVSIIRNLPQASPHHYCIQFSSSLAEAGMKSPRPVFMATRSMTMEPGDGVNLENFLNSYRQFKIFNLVPAALASTPRFLFELGILKRNLTVKSASDVRENDVEWMALRIHGKKAV